MIACNIGRRIDSITFYLRFLGLPDAVKILLNKSDLDRYDNEGNTALLHAAMQGHTACIAALLPHLSKGGVRFHSMYCSIIQYLRAAESAQWIERICGTLGIDESALGHREFSAFQSMCS